MDKATGGGANFVCVEALPRPPRAKIAEVDTNSSERGARALIAGNSKRHLFEVVGGDAAVPSGPAAGNE